MEFFRLFLRTLILLTVISVIGGVVGIGFSLVELKLENIWPFPSYQELTKEKANVLFVETVELINQAEAKNSPEETVKLLNQAKKKLETIISEYSTADLAVKLASGQNVEGVSLKHIDGLLRKSENELIEYLAEKQKTNCYENPNFRCISIKTLATFERIDDSRLKAGKLVQIAKAQAEFGDISGAKQTIASALATAEQIDDSGSDADILVQIAKAQAVFGDISGAKQTIASALATVERIEDSWVKGSDLVMIVRVLAKMENKP
jgi:hypothetical protein